MKTFLLLLGLSAALPVSAQERASDTYVHLTGRAWHTLDPGDAYDAVSEIITGNVYEPLLAFKSVDDTGSFEPFLASQVPTAENGLVSDGGRTYRFPIRKDVSFHDGAKLTPEDVRYSLLRFMLLDSEGGPAALLLKPILGVYSTRDGSGKIVLDFQKASDAVRVDGDAVVVRLARPDATFLKVIASLPIVVSKAWAAAHDDWDGTAETWKKFNNRDSAKAYLRDHMDGTGPFKLGHINHENRTVILVRNDAYWRKPAALKKVVFAVEPNGGLRLFMLETGDADGAYLEQTYRSYAKKLTGVRILEDAPLTHLGELFFFNFKADDKENDRLGSGRLDGLGVPPDFFSDADVRKAFSFAFNYDRYYKEALDSTGRRAAGPFPPDVLPGPQPAYAHDPRKAEELLKKAWGGAVWEKGFVLPISFSVDNQTRQIAAEVMKDSLEKLNPKFKVRLDPVPSSRIYGEIEKGRLPLFISSNYADYPDAHSFAFGLLHSQGYYPKYQRYSDPEADRLLDEALAQTDSSKRREFYLKLQELAAKDAPQIYTYAPLELKACRSSVQGCDTRVNVSNLGFNGFPYFYAYSKPERP
jgi:peptide/nickel transport system substrate-binding protein